MVRITGNLSRKNNAHKVYSQTLVDDVVINLSKDLT